MEPAFVAMDAIRLRVAPQWTRLRSRRVQSPPHTPLTQINLRTKSPAIRGGDKWHRSGLSIAPNRSRIQSPPSSLESRCMSDVGAAHNETRRGVHPAGGGFPLLLPILLLLSLAALVF